MAGFDKNIKVIVPLLYWLFLAVFIMIFVKALILKTSDREIFVRINDGRMVQMHSYYAPIGDIYSYDNISGELLLLASNEIRYDIYLDLGVGNINAIGEQPKKDWVISQKLWTSKLDSLCLLLADRFKSKNKKQWKDYLVSNRNKQNRGTLISKMATQGDLDTLRHFKMTRNAVASDLKYKRVYPYGDLARRTIGIEYIDNGIEKRNGIEGYYESVLKGKRGKRLERNIVPGVWVPVDDTIDIKPKHGQDIITTIDIPLQELAETALRKCLDSNDAKEGCVILMETRTGHIKALASFSRLNDSTYYENKNIAVGSQYEPGSTFKTVTAMCLLDKGFVDTSDIVPTGMKEFPNATKPIYDVNKKGRDKDVSFARAMEISSNVGISSLVYEHYGHNINSREQFAKDLQKYFLYKTLNCDIAVHEPLPIIRSSRYTDDLLRMSFGYATSMTPLQLLTFYNGIANDGVVVKPMFVRSVMQDGVIIKDFTADTLNKQMCKPETLKLIQDMLRRVVLYGTGRRLKSASYGIAGKSGTAEVNYSKGNVDSKYRMHRASFAGYFPADKPQYSCIVVISEPQKALTHGGDLAAPVFREISDRVMGVNSNMQSVSNKGIQTINKGNDVISYNAGVNNQNKILDTSIVPDVRGWSLADAVYCLEKLGMKVAFEGYGSVKTQSVAPRTKIEKGKLIKLTLKHK